MNPHSPSAFTLIRFTPVTKAGGVLTQHREILGGFTDAEAAFDTAKARAWQALCQLARLADSAPLSGESWDLEIDDTEWGYDLRRNGQIVDRFWVHDARAHEAL